MHAHASSSGSGRTSGALDPTFGQRAAFPLTGTAKEGKPENGEEYLLQVRQEALASAAATLRRSAERTLTLPKDKTSSETEVPKRKRPRIETESLDYDEFTALECYKVAKQVYGPLSYPHSLLDLYERAHTRALDASPVQVDCNSQATWKAHIAVAEPVALDHVSVFRVLKYLARWGTHRWTLQMAVWAWAVLLKVPSVVTSEEMAILRDVVRASGTGLAGSEKSPETGPETSSGQEPDQADAVQQEPDQAEPSEDSGNSEGTNTEEMKELREAFKQIVVQVFGQKDL